MKNPQSPASANRGKEPPAFRYGEELPRALAHSLFSQVGCMK